MCVAVNSWSQMRSEQGAHGLNPSTLPLATLTWPKVHDIQNGGLKQAGDETRESDGQDSLVIKRPIEIEFKHRHNLSCLCLPLFVMLLCTSKDVTSATSLVCLYIHYMLSIYIYRHQPRLQ